MIEQGEIISMFLLSLWKVYIGYSYFAYHSYSFAQATLIILGATLTSYSLSILSMNYIDRLSFVKKFRESKTYSKARNIYSKYGFIALGILAPLIVGIPTFVILSREFQKSKLSILGLLIPSVLFYGVLIYYGLFSWF
ncbi:MAG: hypothetical protein ACPGRE_08660 [Flavobacteriaceae bacterium]